LQLSVAALTALAAALRFGTLDRQSFWVDELVTVSLVRRSFGGMVRAIPHSEATPYLYYVLVWPWTRLFGTGEVGIRSLSALAGTLTVIAAYGAGAALVSRRVGLVAAALVAVNPFLIWYSQEARAYALVTLFVAVGLWFLGRALAGERWGLAGWAIVSGLALATHYFAAFVVVPEAVWLVARVRVRRRALWAVLIPAVVLIAELPLLLAQRGNGASATQSSIVKRVIGVPKDLVVGFSFPGELVGTVVAALLVLAGVVLLVTRTSARERPHAFLTGAIAAFAVVAPIVLAGGGADYVTARNAIVAVVPATVCLGAGYAASRVGVVTAAVLCALSLAIGVSVSLDKKYGRTDWRGLARTIGPASTQRALVVTPDIDPALWRIYLPGVQEVGDRPARVREIVVAGLATQGGFSAGPVKPPPATPRPAPPGFELVGARLTATFALIRYQAVGGRPVAVSVQRLGGLALVPGASALLLERPSGS
jgi:mannosyltransferase